MKKAKQTRYSFNEKWSNNKDLSIKEVLNEESEIFKWIISRNGFKSPDDLKKFLSDKNKILDAGCGNGRIIALLHKYSNFHSSLTGVDLVSSEIAKNNFDKLDRVTFIQRDLLKDIQDLGKFDFIYCQEVLHHIENPEKAFKNLVKALEKNGEIAIYVYKLKSPVREFSDEFIRNKISELNYDEAFESLKGITEIGKVLSDLKIQINVPEVKVLEIKKGQYDLQRFFYHFFLKCFWNNNMSFDENNAVNFDWYHPQICFKYKIDQIKKWFENSDLLITQSNEDFYGITMRGKKIS